MWVQYKQGEAITPQRQSDPQTQSLRYHAPDVPPAMEHQQAKQKEIHDAVENNANSSVFTEYFKRNQPEKQNHFTEKPVAKSTFSSQALLFTDDLQAMTSPHITQTAPNAKIEEQKNEKPRQRSRATHDRALIIFAWLYLFGAALSGVLYAMLSTTQTQYLTYYTSYFIEHMSNASVVECYINLCSLCAIGLTIVVLFGLSALGLPLLFVCLFLKGIGSGVLLLQFFAQYQWRGLLYYFACVGVADVCLATGLCLLACTAAKSATALLQAAFGQQIAVGGSQIRQLMVRYLALLVILLVVCLLCAVMFCVFFGNFQL